MSKVSNHDLFVVLPFHQIHKSTTASRNHTQVVLQLILAVPTQETRFGMYDQQLHLPFVDVLFQHVSAAGFQVRWNILVFLTPRCGPTMPCSPPSRDTRSNG